MIIKDIMENKDKLINKIIFRKNDERRWIIKSIELIKTEFQLIYSIKMINNIEENLKYEIFGTEEEIEKLLQNWEMMDYD